MQHSRQTVLVLMFAALLSASALSVTLARPAPPTEEQKRFAQQKLAMEEQLADMQMKYADSHPRVVALKEQIAHYDRLIPPQAKISVKPRLLHKLRTRRTELRLQLLDAQTKYTDVNPHVRELTEQLHQLDQHIADLQQKRH